MEMIEAKPEAISLADKRFRNIAVVYRLNDDAGWQPGTHHEARYLQSYDPFCDAVEIWICEHGKMPQVWNLYYSKQKPVDYVKETGATGELADMLKRIQSMDASDGGESEAE